MSEGSFISTFLITLLLGFMLGFAVGGALFDRQMQWQTTCVEHGIAHWEVDDLGYPKFVLHELEKPE